MENFKTKVDGFDKEFEFECYDNTEPINIGDKFLFFFFGTADVQKCNSETEKIEINKNDRVYDTTKIDLTTNFWKNCYKIKKTDFDLTTIQ